MNRVLLLALGVLSAIGGFVDIGDLIFNAQAGATFGYQLLWVLPIGVLGIITYSEMCGRVSAASGRTVFDAVRERLGFQFGMATLFAGGIVSVMTLIAEIGGVALAMQLLVDGPYRLYAAVAVIALGLCIARMTFTVIENTFSMFGLALIVFVVAAIVSGVDWSNFFAGLVPHVPSPHHADGATDNPISYAYFVVGLIGAAMTPYEVYFYSSGAIEDHWTLKELGVNKSTAILGYALGGTLSAALMVVAAQHLLPHGRSPETISSIAHMVEAPLGAIGVGVAAIGILFATGGAAIETVLSAAYAICQSFGWEWGVESGIKGAPRFTLLWPVLLIGAGLVTLTGIDPVMVTEHSVIFSTIALPLTYLPILLVANDRRYMGDVVNGRVANTLGIVYFALIMVIAVAAIPLMVLSHSGTAT
jgi:Mn2+/Fe2+ NRAMP family transporter